MKKYVRILKIHLKPTLSATLHFMYRIYLSNRYQGATMSIFNKKWMIRNIIGKVRSSVAITDVWWRLEQFLLLWWLSCHLSSSTHAITDTSTCVQYHTTTRQRCDMMGEEFFRSFCSIVVSSTFKWGGKTENFHFLAYCHATIALLVKFIRLRTVKHDIATSSHPRSLQNFRSFQWAWHHTIRVWKPRVLWRLSLLDPYTVAWQTGHGYFSARWEGVTHCLRYFWVQRFEKNSSFAFVT